MVKEKNLIQKCEALEEIQPYKSYSIQLIKNKKVSCYYYHYNNNHTSQNGPIVFCNSIHSHEEYALQIIKCSWIDLRFLNCEKINSNSENKYILGLDKENLSIFSFEFLFGNIL